MVEAAEVGQPMWSRRGSQDILESILQGYRKVFQIALEIIFKLKLFPQGGACEGSGEYPDMVGD